MKITKADVGKKICRSWWQGVFITVTAVGEDYLLALPDKGGAEECHFSEGWEYYQEPRKKHRAAPALVLCGDFMFISDSVYKSREEAEGNYRGRIQWPASENSWVEWEE